MNRHKRHKPITAGAPRVTPFRYSSSTLAVLALKNVRFPRISMVLTKLQTEFKDG
uniref:Uncharacterized protein n=1 Tax=Ascaris lumbricoides TaxID=6252 RepID=A0A0M3HZF6_ASCLU